MTPYQMAERLLTLVVQHFKDAGVALPSVQYVAPGMTVAYDTEQITCHVTGVLPGQPGNAASALGVQYPVAALQYAELAITIVRDTPVVDDQGAPPSSTALDANAQLAIGDLYTLYMALNDIRYSNELVESNTPFNIVGVRPYGPEGGVVGTIGTVQIQLFE